jgi:hypothetical protein
MCEFSVMWKTKMLTFGWELTLMWGPPNLHSKIPFMPRIWNKKKPWKKIIPRHMVKFHLDSIIFLSLCFYKLFDLMVAFWFQQIFNLLGISKSCPHCIFQMYCVHSFHLVLFILITFCYGLSLSTLIVNYVVGSFCFLFNFGIVFKISWCQFHVFLCLW